MKNKRLGPGSFTVNNNHRKRIDNNGKPILTSIAGQRQTCAADKSSVLCDITNVVTKRKYEGYAQVTCIEISDDDEDVEITAKKQRVSSQINNSTLSSQNPNNSSSNENKLNTRKNILNCSTSTSDFGTCKYVSTRLGPGKHMFSTLDFMKTIGTEFSNSNLSSKPAAIVSTEIVQASLISNDRENQFHNLEEEDGLDNTNVIQPEVSIDTEFCSDGESIDASVERDHISNHCGIESSTRLSQSSISSMYKDLGDPIYECEYCGGLMWYAERATKWYNPKKPKFSLCCSQGKIQLPMLEDAPPVLHDLFHKKDKKSSFFLQNIRSFNAMFSFTSMGGKVNTSINEGNSPPIFVMNGEVYHRIGSLLPLEGSQPRFSQMYIYDTGNEIDNRMSAVKMSNDSSSIQVSVVTELKDMLDVVNPYVKIYRMVRDRIVMDDTKEVKLRIIGKRTKDGRMYNLPTATEVAALIVGDFDNGDENRDIIIEERSGNLQRVKLLSAAYLPLQYPLLFPCGEDGYRDDIPLRKTENEESRKRKRVSMREFFAYRIQQRKEEKSTLLKSRRLFQQFLVDAFSMIESSRLQYIRTHQSELRADLYKSLSEAILNGETESVSVGKRIVLPSSFTGGARYMFQNYQDAMGICRWTGYPDLFITFTCNHKWPEITRWLEILGLKPEDRPDIACCAFKMKLDDLIKDIKKGDLFGKVVAVIYTVEFQKRGLPHAHILVFLDYRNKYPKPDDIDKIISAEIPDKETEPELFGIVESFMIHGPCGYLNGKSPCMQNGKCSKYFPKRFVNETAIDNDGYPVYKRTDNGRRVKKGKHMIDNRFVVPYNKDLLLRFNAHINVEWCNQSRSIKYLFKYINKGHDRVTTTFHESSNGSSSASSCDEIKLYYDCRYLSACEASWRIFAFEIHDRDPPVERLPLHLKDNHVVVYKDKDKLQQAVDKPFGNITKFIGWMEANKQYPEAKSLLYAEFPTRFVWKPQEHQWTPRKQGFSIGRVHFIPPGSGEIFYLRILLNVQRGCASYEDIKTVKNVLYETFKDACYALGLLNDDKEYIDCIKQASFWATATFLRRLFAALLFTLQLCSPEIVWDNTWVFLSDDILHRQRKLRKDPGLSLSDEQLKNFALAEIEMILQSNNKSLSHFASMPQPDAALLSECQNRLIYDELNYDREALAAEQLDLISKMTEEQKQIYDKVIQATDKDLGGLFFIYGYGGTGKTFLWRAIAATIRSRGEIVLTVASSGIAALLIPGGRTAHSRFSIPINIDEDSTCNIKQGTDLAELIIKAKLIIWDEAPMCHRHVFEAVDRTLRDILRFTHADSLTKPFGGKVVVLGGDFRQILPVVPKGSRQDIVHAAINSSNLWHHCQVLRLTKNMRLQGGSSRKEIQDLKKFSDWILGIGDGIVGNEVNDEIKVKIPDDLLIKNTVDPIVDIVNTIYPNFLKNMFDASFFKDRAILGPTNEIVDRVNYYMLSLMPSEEITYLSSDTTCPSDNDFGSQENIHTPEFLNTIRSSGIPNHEIKLKVGVPIMLLRNIDPSLGMCNGTRLVVTQMAPFILEAKVISGSNIGQKVLIPRMSLTPSDKRIPFKFQRKQFPIMISFAMTINKSQGQSLQHVGIYLPKPVFSHGQLYVAISRVTNRKGLKILIEAEDGEQTNEIINIVYKEAFRNLH